MPVEFLTEEQRQRYGRFQGEPSPEILARYFHLDDSDRERIARHRGEHNRLGFAVQLCTVRFLGTFLEDLCEVPATIPVVLAHQLGIEHPEGFATYSTGEQRWEHAEEIRQQSGYHHFSAPFAQFRLNRWLYALCWTGTDRPGALFERATTWLLSHKILLPGVTVLERQIAHLRNRVHARLWKALGRGVSPAAQARLFALLTVPPPGPASLLDRLRKGPFRRSAPELVRALQRVETVRALGLPEKVSARIPPGRIQALARFAMTAKVSTIERFPDARRLATLVAFAVMLEAAALDDALDLLDILITEIFSDATAAGEQARLRTLKDLDQAASQLGHACRVVLAPDVPDLALRATIFSTLSREDLGTALARLDRLVRAPEDHYYTELQQSWRRVRWFLPALLKTISFGATPAGQGVVEAMSDLATHDGQLSAVEPRLDLIPKSWRHYVLPHDGEVDKKAYVFCWLDRLRSALRRRDVFVIPSLRYADARRGLLSGPAWEASRLTLCRSLGHSPSAEATLSVLREELDDTYRTVAAKLATNPAVRIETTDGKDDLVLSGLEKLEDPPSLVRLRQAIKARLPRVDLPEILLEIAARTNFPAQFTHVSEQGARVEDLPLSVCAVLLAEACNIGLEPLVQNDLPALRRARLSWVQQNFLREETLITANTCLVAAQNRIPLVQAWGGGEVASADGLRFVVPIQTLHAGPNPKYFGYKRGATYYNLMSNQFTSLNGIVIPGTLRDSLYLLALVLEQETELAPVEIMTDTGAYTDVVFGLFRLLGYRFSPRIADVGGTRYWRIDPTADYGALNGIARHRINTRLITTYWDDMLRLAGSLKLGVVQATAIMRTLQLRDRPTKLAQAVAEFGRIEKTLHCLTYLDDEPKRRRTLRQLNRGEDRHKLARAVFHGKRGELRQRYREGQEDQLGALGLVLNIIVLWNTLYMEAVLEQLQREGFPVSPADVARLSPLLLEHINMLGRYAFLVPDAVRRGELRPLRTVTDDLNEVA
jgi:TnpA family transposase